MAQRRKSKTRWQDKLQQSLRQDPRKATVLVGLSILLVVLSLRFFAGGNTPPAAIANPLARLDLSHNKSVMDPVASLVQQRLSAWVHATVPPLSRNLFTVNLDFYPQDAGRQTQDAQLGDDFWDRLQKSMNYQADQKIQREQHIQRARDDASKLRLQSTMMGAVPKALVNGMLVKEGDTLRVPLDKATLEFKVLKITPRSIVVERYGIRLEVAFR